MPKYKSLIVGSAWKQAGRQRKCYHSPGHSIQKGDDVLEVNVNPGVQGYCLVCGEAMIQTALATLSQMKPLSKI